MRGEKVHQQALHLAVGAEPPRHPEFLTYGVRLADGGWLLIIDRAVLQEIRNAPRTSLGLSPRCLSSTSTPLTRMDPARRGVAARARDGLGEHGRVHGTGCTEEHEASPAAARRPGGPPASVQHHVTQVTAA